MVEARRTVLVTGAARGLGRGIALRFARESWRVAALDRDEVGLAALGDRLPGALMLVADVSDETAVAAAFARVAETFGRLDALVNNAGLAQPVTGPLQDLDRARWDRVLATNLTGPMLCAKHALKLLRASGHAAIVNVASTRAHQSEPQCEAYAASKGGLLALTHAMAISLGPRVRVNAVTPGWIHDSQRTEAVAPTVQDHAFHPAGRVGHPDDVAGVVHFLCSEDAAFVTGAEYACDGGVPRKMIYPE